MKVCVGKKKNLYYAAFSKELQDVWIMPGRRERERGAFFLKQSGNTKSELWPSLLFTLLGFFVLIVLMMMFLKAMLQYEYV